jgi:hypothetical protein
MVHAQAAVGPRRAGARLDHKHERVNEALGEALLIHTDSKERWDKLIAEGAHDNDIWDALHREFGATGGGAQSLAGIQFAYLGGHARSEPPRFWVDSATPMTAQKPTLSGAALVRRVREVLAIPQPKPTEAGTPEAARETEDLAEIYGAGRKFPAALVEAGWRLAQEGHRFYARNDRAQGMTILHDTIEGAAEEAARIDERRGASPVKKGAPVSTGAKKQRAKALDLPGMEDRRIKEVHELAVEFAETKQEQKRLKLTLDDVSARLALAMHRHNMREYRHGGLVVTLEEVEKVKVTTGKSDEEED